MSGSTNEDEWDAAEVRLKELTVKEKKPPVKLLLKPPVSLTSNTSGTSSSAGTESPKLGSTAELDSVLLDAISDPRERMIVFQIENNILNFMNSNESTMEVPPSYNSFRRLLSYRLGQRFGLSHTNDQLNENGERTILLYKTPSSSIPSTLLIDMSTGTPTGGSTPELRTDAVKQGASAAAAAPQRKMQVMKRAPAKEQVQSVKSSGGGKQQQSTEDKEKAYLEARARIFGETGTPNSEGSCSSPVGDSTQQSSGNSTPKSEATSLQGADGGASSGAGQIPKCPSSGSLSAGIASQNASQRRQSDPPQLKSQSHQSPIEKSTSSNSLNAAEVGGSRRAPVNAGTWKENKSQLRNQDAERSDPDFVRRGNAGSRHNPNSNAGRGNQQGGVGGSGYAVKPGSQPQQLPPQQQYAMYADPATAAQMQAQMQMQMHMQAQAQQAQMQAQYHMYQQHPYPPAGTMGAYPMGPGQQPGQYYMAAPLPPGVPFGTYAPHYPAQQHFASPQQLQQQQRAGNKGPAGGMLNNNDFPPLS